MPRVTDSCKHLKDKLRKIHKDIKVKIAQLCPTLCNPMTIQSMEFSRPEYWSGLPCPPPGDLPNPGWTPRLLPWQADPFTTEPLQLPAFVLSTEQTNIPPHVYTFLLKCITSVSWMFQVSLKASPPDGLLPLISSLTSEPLCKVTCCCC